jgi:hypothetical protein
MQRARVPALVFLFTILAVAPSMAFVVQTVNFDDKLYNPRWPAESLPIPFVVNNRPLELLPNLASNSTPLAAIEGALRTWSIEPVGLYLDRTVATASYAPDGANLITIVDTDRNRDLVGNSWATSTVWFQKRGDQVHIVEADIVLNPRHRFATDGAANARDLQDELTHGLGWALGLSHSPIAAASTFPIVHIWQTYRRSLEPDDRAGLHALYGGVAGSDVGAIAGRVVTVDDIPVFGAHVVATDAEGIVRVGALSDWDGGFSLTSLPAGSYQVYAEPLDRPLTPAYYTYAFRDIRRDFRTTFAGGNLTPIAVAVTVGETTFLEPIRVEAQPSTLNPWHITWSPDGISFRNGVEQAVQIEPGHEAFLAVVGDGLRTVLRAGFSISGGDVTFDTSRITRGTSNLGAPYAILQLSVRPGAPRGARNLYLANATERAAFTGCIEVVAP